MQAIAHSRGFETHQLKTTQATREAVSEAIARAADELIAGDFFLLSYAGHGGQLTDRDGDEADGKDDTWCLYDGQLLDDELTVLFARFQPGVRVLVLSDSCHSGTMLKSASPAVDTVERVPDDFTESRLMPRATAIDVGEAYRAFYADIQRKLPRPKPRIQATVRLLSGCQEHEQSFGNKETGRFTAAVKEVFADGTYPHSYQQFHIDIQAAVAKAMNPQTPGHMLLGSVNDEFDREQPFTL